MTNRDPYWETLANTSSANGERELRIDPTREEAMTS